jgi:hypothetical protein
VLGNIVVVNYHKILPVIDNLQKVNFNIVSMIPNTSLANLSTNFQ